MAETVPVRVINQDAEQELHKIAIRYLVRKLDRRLLPLIIVLEISSFINRVTIGVCTLAISVLFDITTSRSC